MPAERDGSQKGNALPNLSELIAQRRDEIVERFVARTKAQSAAEALPDDHVSNSLGEFLDELVAAVKREEPGRSASAIRHGEQRFNLGYEIGAVVREYGVLRDLLYDVVEESGVSVSVGEMRRLAHFFINAIGDAASRYGSARDEELRRRTSQHVGFLAHELRNLLGSVKLGFDLMRERGDIRASRSVGAVERGLARLGMLIDDSLVTSRLAQTTDVDCVTLDARQLVEDVARESAAEMELKEITLSIEGAGSLCADPKVLRSAISNLVRNAVKFTARGKSIHLRVKEADARVVIEVEDACGGLPPGATKKLFDPFVQAGSDRSGFGLGLAISKQAAEAHRGEIRVHDIPGKGCAFILDLPQRPPPVS